MYRGWDVRNPLAIGGDCQPDILKFMSSSPGAETPLSRKGDGVLKYSRV